METLTYSVQRQSAAQKSPKMSTIFSFPNNIRLFNFINFVLFCFVFFKCLFDFFSIPVIHIPGRASGVIANSAVQVSYATDSGKITAIINLKTGASLPGKQRPFRLPVVRSFVCLFFILSLFIFSFFYSISILLFTL
jgi:hypothetical protein